MTSIEAYLCGSCDAIFDGPVGPVYECSRCGATQVEERRCDSCHIFMAKLADETCPECESGEPDISTVTVYESSDGERHLSAELAATWDADAPERAAQAQAHRDEMDAYLARIEVKNRAKAERLLPPLRRLAERLTAAPRMLETVILSINALERDPGSGTTYTMMVGLDELSRLLLPGDETERAITVGHDYGLPHDERGAAARAILDRLLPLLTPEMADRFNDGWTSFGCAHGFEVDVLLDQFDCWDEQ